MKKGQTKKEPLSELRMYFARLPDFEKVEGPVLGNFDHTIFILKPFGEFTGRISGYNIMFSVTYLDQSEPDICFDRF